MQSQHQFSSQSFWTDNTKDAEGYRSLKSGITADVVIVGGGITGLISALELTTAGREVVVLEADRIGGSTTGFSTGNLYIPLQTRYKNIKQKFDADTVKAIAWSRKEAIDFVERTVQENNIDCKFHRRPWYMYTNDPQKESIIDDEVALLKEAGLEIETVSSLPLSAGFIKAAKMENQARFNPYKFVTDLAEILVKQGCRIYENSPVIRMDHDSERVKAQTNQGRVDAGYLIEATHIPKGINTVQTLVYPHRSYVVAAEINGSYPDGNFWDMDSDPAGAISSHGIHSDELEMLMFAGNHHKTGQSDKSYSEYYRELERSIEKRYPGSNIKYHWSAQHYTSADGVPYIGKSTSFSDRMLMGTGFSTDGLTYGVIAGIIVSNIITGKDNPWLKTYDSTRIKPAASAAEFVKENINVAGRFIKDYPDFGEVSEFSEIGRLEGKTIQYKGEKLAAYRNEHNELHVYSAICPHMKCIVNWNDAEKTWDCPCHGSRFSTNGDVIEGPALEALEKKDIRTLKDS